MLYKTMVRELGGQVSLGQHVTETQRGVGGGGWCLPTSTTRRHSSGAPVESWEDEKARVLNLSPRYRLMSMLLGAPRRDTSKSTSCCMKADQDTHANTQ